MKINDHLPFVSKQLVLRKKTQKPQKVSFSGQNCKIGLETTNLLNLNIAQPVMVALVPLRYISSISDFRSFPSRNLRSA